MDEKEKDADLWEKLEITITLAGEGFPDDKIYGYIDVNPSSSRRLIKAFQLVVDGNSKRAIQFDARFKNFSASGFSNSGQNLRQLHVEVLPMGPDQNLAVKKSNICSFFFNGMRYTSNPKLGFEPNEKDEKRGPILLIKWTHIGDEDAHRYLLYLDNLEIHQIGLDSIDDTIEVRIRNWEIGTSHSIQLVAKLNNGKETYRSDLLTFVVPDKRQDEMISVSDDPMPAALSVLIDPVGTMKSELPPMTSSSPPKKDKKNICLCGLPLPHDTFLGVDHYFKIIDYSL